MELSYGVAGAPGGACSGACSGARLSPTIGSAFERSLWLLVEVVQTCNPTILSFRSVSKEAVSQSISLKTQTCSATYKFLRVIHRDSIQDKCYRQVGITTEPQSVAKMGSRRPPADATSDSSTSTSSSSSDEDSSKRKRKLKAAASKAAATKKRRSADSTSPRAAAGDASGARGIGATAGSAGPSAGAVQAPAPSTAAADKLAAKRAKADALMAKLTAKLDATSNAAKRLALQDKMLKLLPKCTPQPQAANPKSAFGPATSPGSAGPISTSSIGSGFQFKLARTPKAATAPPPAALQGPEELARRRQRQQRFAGSGVVEEDDEVGQGRGARACACRVDKGAPGLSGKCGQAPGAGARGSEGGAALAHTQRAVADMKRVTRTGAGAPRWLMDPCPACRALPSRNPTNCTSNSHHCLHFATPATAPQSLHFPPLPATSRHPCRLTRC